MNTVHLILTAMIRSLGWSYLVWLIVELDPGPSDTGIHTKANSVTRRHITRYLPIQLRLVRQVLIHAHRGLHLTPALPHHTHNSWLFNAAVITIRGGPPVPHSLRYLGKPQAMEQAPFTCH